MKLHVLPGNSLVEEFTKTGIKGDVAVCRECLVDGPVNADSLTEFWKMREAFLADAYGEVKGSYFKEVVTEFEKLNDLSADDEVNLWFEHELFCSVNMWFCLSLLHGTESRVYRIEPVLRENDERWSGFCGVDSNDLNECFSERKELSREDIEFGANLWTAYQDANHGELSRLSGNRPDRFPFLEEIVEAAIEEETRPLKILKEIRQTGLSDFADVFAEFSRRAGVYGFGDAQVKRLL